MMSAHTTITPTFGRSLRPVWCAGRCPPIASAGELHRTRRDEPRRALRRPAVPAGPGRGGAVRSDHRGGRRAGRGLGGLGERSGLAHARVPRAGRRGRGARRHRRAHPPAAERPGLSPHLGDGDAAHPGSARHRRLGCARTGGAGRPGVLRRLPAAVPRRAARRPRVRGRQARPQPRRGPDLALLEHAPGRRLRRAPPGRCRRDRPAARAAGGLEDRHRLRAVHAAGRRRRADRTAPRPRPRRGTGPQEVTPTRWCPAACS
jgi:hypothetical protein